MIKYSNIIFTGATDIDGCTLFAFNGGGALFHIDPVTSATNPSAKTSINIIQNPSGILVLKEKPSAEEEGDDLAINEKNAATISITQVLGATNLTKALDKKIEWSIEGVDEESGELSKKAKNPGEAAFLEKAAGGGLSLGSTKIVGGRSVLVYGIKEGRVRITAIYLAERRCRETYEALVVSQKVILFRVQLLKGQPKGGTKVSTLLYGNIIVHEVGHGLALRHRGGRENDDRLVKPGELNLMFSDTANLKSEDLDLGQCLGSRGSKLFFSGK